MAIFPHLALAVLAALAALALLMGFTVRFRVPPGGDRGGSKRLGIAVELSQGREDFVRKVGAAGTPEGDHNRVVLRRQQFLDLPFIALYLALFWILGEVESAQQFAGARLLGIVTRAAIVLAALFDVLEDVAILRAIRDDHYPRAIRRFGLPKWLFFFLAAAGAAGLFLNYPAHRPLAMLIGLLVGAGGLLGLAEIAARRQAWVELAAGLISTGLAVLLVLLVLLAAGF